MKDGVVWGTLESGGDPQAFQDQLLAAIKQMSGGDAA